jgi:hypothetical protein
MMRIQNHCQFILLFPLILALWHSSPNQPSVRLTRLPFTFGLLFLGYAGVASLQICPEIQVGFHAGGDQQFGIHFVRPVGILHLQRVFPLVLGPAFADDQGNL